MLVAPCREAAGSTRQVSPVWMGFVSQGLEALSGPRSSSITRRAAGFPMLFLCIVSGENPAQARPLLTRCIQTLLGLATMALPQDWDQTLDLPQVTAVHTDPFAIKASLGMRWSAQSPSEGSVCIGYCSMRLSVPGAARLSSHTLFQVCALHVLQTLVRGAGLGTALLRHATPMVALALQGLSSPCWAMRNAAIQLFSEYPSPAAVPMGKQEAELHSKARVHILIPSFGWIPGLERGIALQECLMCSLPTGALTTRLLGQKQSSVEGCLVEGLSLPAFLGQHPQLGAVLLAELGAAVPGGPHLRPALHAILTLLAQLQPGPDDPSG